MNAEVANMINKARYYRLQAKANKAKRKFEVDLSPEQIKEVDKRITEGQTTNRIACNMGITKEYVDAIRIKHSVRPMETINGTSLYTQND